MKTLRIEHIHRYLLQLSHKDVVGIRNDIRETLVARAWAFTFKTQGYLVSYDLMQDADGYHWLPESVARLQLAFDTCTLNDFAAYDTHEDGLTKAAYIHRFPWFKEMHGREMAKVYSPTVYERYYHRSRQSRKQMFPQAQEERID